MTTYSPPFMSKPVHGLQLGDLRDVWDGMVNANSFSKAYGIIAAGTTQATATKLTAVLNEVDTVGSGSGVALPSSTGKKNSPYSFCSIVNNGANTLTIYTASATADTINGIAGSTGITLAAGTALLFISAKPGAWFSTGSAANSSSSSPVVTSPYYKLLPRTASKLAKIRAGVTTGTNGIDGQFKIGILGDSTTAGAGAGTSGTTNITGSRAHNIIIALANMLNNENKIVANTSTFMGDQYTFGAYGNATSYPLYDPRLSFAGGAQVVGNANFRSAGGIYFRLGVGASMTFDPGIAWDTAVIFAANDAVGVATMTLGNSGAITGTATITNTAVNVSALKQQIITISKATTTLIFTRTSGNPDIRGAWLYDSTTPAINLFGLGAYGLQLSVEATGNGTSCGYNTAIASDLYDLLIVNMMINDTVNTPLATYMAALDVVVKAQQATGGDVIVATPNCFDTSAHTLTPSYLTAVRSYCSTNNIVLIDSYAEQISYAATNGNGLMFDGLHPTAAGYADTAQRYERPIFGG